MNLCSFGLHDWDKYGDIETRVMGEWFAGILIRKFIQKRQSHKCKRCGLIEFTAISDEILKD